MISKYERTILNKLLDKFETSKSFTGDNKVNQKFVAKVESMFPQYADHSNFELFQAINEAIDILVRKSIISAKISKANVCSVISLNLDTVNQAYQYIGRIPKRDINNAVLMILDGYREKNEILRRFCEAQAERINANKSIQFFNENLQEFENILIAVDSLLKVETETFIRDFSVRIYKDSKVFDRISNKVVNLLYEYGDFPEKDQVLESLNIIKNPTYVNFKGSGVITIAGQRLDLSVLKSDIAISSFMLEDIDKIEIIGDAVMTVENLTSFHTTECSSRFLIYLGGFHNKIRREFIKKIFKQNPGVTFYHFGDIDAGGFYILDHLRRKTGIGFLPYMMDLVTLKNHLAYTKSLTESDRERLKKIMTCEFNEVIQYMLNHNCKLEQEAILAF